MKTLKTLDIVMSIYNQEKIIQRILGQLFRNTVTPFNLILVFDGCTDNTKSLALEFINSNKPAHFKRLVTQDTPNIYETRANNIGFKLVSEPYFITLQDDMEIREPGWDVRLTYPLRKFNDVLAVTGRIAQDVVELRDSGMQVYGNRAGREFLTLPRTMFAVRDVINRGPVAFKTEYLQQLGYLNDSYAPSDLDDADLSLRAWKKFNYRCGAFWIDYFSDPSWSKAKAADSTMGSASSSSRNALRLRADHNDYFSSTKKHDENILINEEEIDYPDGFDRMALKASIAASQRIVKFQYYKKLISWWARKGPKLIVKKILSALGLYTSTY